MKYTDYKIRYIDESDEGWTDVGYRIYEGDYVDGVYRRESVVKEGIVTFTGVADFAKILDRLNKLIALDKTRIVIDEQK